MNREQLAEQIYKTSHITGEFLLRSGRISNEYFDKYQFESNPILLDEIATHFLNIIPQDFDYFAALEMGGIPIASILSIKTGKPVVFVRKKSKEYGTCKFAEGPQINNKKLLIVEDVVTSGGQIILSANDLRNSGAIITDSICVIDRQAGGREALNEIGIELKELFTMSYIKSLIK